MTVLIHRNSNIPLRKSLTVTTVEDNQTSMVIKVFEGEREMASDNKFLGYFLIDEIPPGEKETQEIFLTLDVSDGVINLHGKVGSTGREFSFPVKTIMTPPSNEETFHK